MCLVKYSFFALIPINHDDPDGINLSNVMLALVVLNNSIIRPPSFHLPFICHPSFMAFVKLNRSWFSSGTIFISQVSLAMDTSLCLQMTSNFPLWVQLMLFPFLIIIEPFMETKSYTPILLLVICLVAAESPMKMFFPTCDSSISFVTRAFSFSPFFLEYRDDIGLFSISVGQVAFLPFPHPY